jgi:hypothetical protein
MSRGAAIISLLCAAACHGSHSHSGRLSDAGGSDRSLDAGGFTLRGGYRCCLEEAGTSCCAGTAQGTCFAYGGSTGECAGESETIDAKDTCAICCEGLQPLHASVPGNEIPSSLDGQPEGCDPVPIPSLFLCLACGDGTCGKGETYCSCPADCPPP